MSAPLLFDSDRYLGGFTGAGFSIPFNPGAYSGTITVNIPPGSTIRRAFLIVGKQGPATPNNIMLNGSPFPLTPFTAAISPPFNSMYGGNSNVHIRDCTSVINPTQNTYTISVPNQPSGPSNRFTDFYLIIKYNNLAYSFINTYIFINRDNFGSTGVQSYPLLFAMPLNNALPVNLSGMLGYTCDNVNGGDGTHVSVNGTPLGGNNSRIGGPNPNSPGFPSALCQGPHGDFDHGNGVLTGLNGCSNSIAMGGTIPYDVVSDVRTLLTNNATGFTVGVTPEVTPNASNAVWAWFVSYNDNSEVYECPACINNTVTNLTPTTARLNWGGCSPHIPFDSVVLSIGPVINPPFVVGDIITGQTSGATATVTIVGTGVLQVNNITGTFQAFEPINGSISNASSTIITIQTPSVVNRIQWRPSTSAIWTTQVVTNVNFLDITGLTSGIQYTWQVINLDTDGAVCAPTPFMTFNTP